MSLEGQKDAMKQRMLAAPIIRKKEFKAQESGPDTKSHIKQKTATPVLYSQAAAPVAMQLFEVLKVLKECGKPLDNQGIINKAAVDVSASKALQEKLKNNVRVTYDEKKGTYAFKPRYDVRTKEGLLKLLKSMQGTGGMELKELKDSYSGAEQLVNELEQVGSVLVIRSETKNNAPRSVYFNDTSRNLVISDEFKKIWHDTVIPPTLDLTDELRKAKLKPMQVLVPKVKALASSTKTKKKRAGNRFKMTNTHLAGLGIDLSKDYVNPDNK
ncbi:hypothetical protein HDV03_005545 [Kappamyces sp. JEL0829]|nr:hypothetical protein HDV03_005545 [Kappamyces sp. JEL0829]